MYATYDQIQQYQQTVESDAIELFKTICNNRSALSELNSNARKRLDEKCITYFHK